MRIAAVKLAVPDDVQTAEDLAPLLHRSADWIGEHTGVLRRHVAPNEMTPSQLAAQASRAVIQQTGEPDLILYSGALIQQLVPDTASFVHRELELERVPGFSINHTCLSFIAALQVADGLMKAGYYRRVLICSAELATRGRCFDEPESAALMGDGAAATMLEYTPDASSQLVSCELETWSTGIDLCYVQAGIGMHSTPVASRDNMYHFHMQGPQLYRFVRPRLKKFLHAFLTRSRCSVKDVRLVVPHQASGPGLRLLEQIGFEPDRIVNIIADYGNCVAASIPMALAVAVEQQRIVRGDPVLFVGTAAGVSLGAALLRW